MLIKPELKLGYALMLIERTSSPTITKPHVEQSLRQLQFDLVDCIHWHKFREIFLIGQKNQLRHYGTANA
jgi:hypothetical protein